MMRTTGKMVATTPFGDLSVKHKVASGVAIMETKISLKPLRVVFPSEDYFAGATVYVQADVANRHAWARQTYELDGIEFILIPTEAILLADYPDNSSRT